MFAACGILDVFIVLSILLIISVALAQDEDQFIYNGFKGEKLHLGGIANVHPSGLLQLTNSSQQSKGYAFYKFPFEFNTSSSSSSPSLSFSTNFVFAMVPKSFHLGGNGMAFVISPSMDFSEALAGPHLGLFNTSNMGHSTNHILAVELDTVQNLGFNDADENHVGIDVNSVISDESATATYFSDKGRNKSLKLGSGHQIQIWIDYNGAEKLLNVTLAPISIPKPSRPLLSAAIDLSQILLDSMYVGFTAATGTVVSDHYVLGWSFNRNGKAEDIDISKLPSLPPAPSPPRKGKQKAELMIIVSVVAVAGLLMTTVSGAVCIARKKKYEEVYEDWEREYGPHRFSYKTLYKATNGFKDKELIGKGGFGKVYGGVLPSSNKRIAVKRISHDSKQGMKEFVTEIVSLGRLRHKNLVQLCGYCRQKGELLLVYDYMPNGSLDKHLYSNKKPNLSWFQRFRILRGVASGIFYLHEEWEQVVLHRDIKPGNVLLDSDLNGKLGDFGLAKLYEHGSNPQTTKVVGTIGYLAPEFVTSGKATTSTDVYAFGVFMLEVACGKMSMEQNGCAVIDCWRRGAILDASDPRLEGSYAEDQMELVLKLGLFCSHPNPTSRPSMRQVMQYLDGDAKLPDIQPDKVIDFFGATKEISNIQKTFPSLLGTNSAQITSTIDSILVEGR